MLCDSWFKCLLALCAASRSIAKVYLASNDVLAPSHSKFLSHNWRRCFNEIKCGASDGSRLWCVDTHTQPMHNCTLHTEYDADTRRIHTDTHTQCLHSTEIIEFFLRVHVLCVLACLIGVRAYAAATPWTNTNRRVRLNRSDLYLFLNSLVYLLLCAPCSAVLCASRTAAQTSARGHALQSTSIILSIIYGLPSCRLVVRAAAPIWIV